MNVVLSHLASSSFPCAVTLAGLASWLSIAVYNNVRDAGTNLHLLGLMVRMDLVRQDPEIGKGLLYRARQRPSFPANLLRAVVVGQTVVALLLWIAAIVVIERLCGLAGRETAVGVAHLALAAFVGIWTTFLCGGLWFGYWMKMPQVQQVHLSLFTISLIMFVLIDRLQ